jgi:hypothetical protein
MVYLIYRVYHIIFHFSPLSGLSHHLSLPTPRLPRTVLSWCVFLHEHGLYLHGCGKFWLSSLPFNHTTVGTEVQIGIATGIFWLIRHHPNTSIVQICIQIYIYITLKIPTWTIRKMISKWYPNTLCHLCFHELIKLAVAFAGWSAAGMAKLAISGNSDGLIQPPSISQSSHVGSYDSPGEFHQGVWFKLIFKLSQRG